MRSRGWLVLERLEYVVLVASLDPDNGMYGDAIAIPKGMISVMRELKFA